MISIAILGATGRLGQEIIKAAPRELFSFSALLASANNANISRDLGLELGLGALGVSVTSVQNVLPKTDVLIDVSSPEGTQQALSLGLSQNIPLLIATTGLPSTTEQQIKEASAKIPVLQAANLSIGINLLARVVEFAAKTLGESFDIEIVEAHHRKKKDSPSGTALLLAKSAAAGRSLDLNQSARHGRQGIVGERGPSEIGLHAVRGGSVIGDHQVLFLGDGERLTFGHMAESRAVFAHGALRAARWLAGKPAGLYSMSDVLKS